MPAFTARSDYVNIDAPQQLVWDILRDIRRYPEWNPFTERVITDFKPGSPIELHVHLPGRGRSVQREFITHLEPPSVMGWGMNILHDRLLKARRLQTIEKLAPDRCCYHTEDHITGLLCPLVRLLYLKSMTAGFNAMAHALKHRAECEFQSQTHPQDQKAYS